MVLQLLVNCGPFVLGKVGWELRVGKSGWLQMVLLAQESRIRGLHPLPPSPQDVANRCRVCSDSLSQSWSSIGGFVLMDEKKKRIDCSRKTKSSFHRLFLSGYGSYLGLCWRSQHYCSARHPLSLVMHPGEHFHLPKLHWAERPAQCVAPLT